MVAWTVYLTQDSRDGGVLPHWKICREGHRACSVLREDPSPTSPVTECSMLLWYALVGTSVLSPRCISVDGSSL